MHATLAKTSVTIARDYASLHSNQSDGSGRSDHVTRCFEPRHNILSMVRTQRVGSLYGFGTNLFVLSTVTFLWFSPSKLN